MHPQKVSIETFTDKKTLTDGTQYVELYNLGSNPHTDEIVLVYLPKQKMAFISDLFPPNLMGQNRPADPVNYFLFKKIKELGLDIKTFVSGHGRLGTIDELKKIVGEK